MDRLPHSTAKHGLMTFRCQDECVEKTYERSEIHLSSEDIVTIVRTGSVDAGILWGRGRYDGFFDPRCRFCGKRFRYRR